MKTRIIALAVTAACASAAVAQSQYEALQFMGNELNGTARFVGMGGAMSSLGADLSTMSTNPAGIGMYRSHDVAVSFGFNNTRTNADFAGSTTKENRTRASFDQIGFVWSTKIGNKTDLRYLNFGFNYHKRANFNRQFYAKGNLNGASMTYQMAKMIGSVASTWDDLITLWNAGIKGVDNRNPYIHEDFYSVPYLGMMGARTNLVYGGRDSEGEFFTSWNGETGEYYSREEGGINQYDFNLSFNVRDRFYFGMTLGLYDINYNLYSSYGELLNRPMPGSGSDYCDPMPELMESEVIPNLADFTLGNWYKAEGTGVDLKLGMIIRPFEYSPFRFGFAVHTPIWYNITDRYTASLTSNFGYDNGSEYVGVASVTESLSDYFPDMDYVWDYCLTTPWRFNVSAGTIVGGIMALDAEYEYEKYSSAKLKDREGYDLSSTSSISETLKGVHTFRAGMETKLTDAFSLRVGYNYQSSPIVDDAFRNIEATDNTRTVASYMNPKSRQAVTFGLGYRGRLFYADVAYKYDFYKSDFYMFDDVALQATKVTNERHQLLLTLGVHF